MSKKHHKLLSNERDQIALWSAEKVGIRENARRLNRSPSTIHNEIKRNRFGNYYVAITAQAKATKRKLLAGKRQPLKSATTFSYVLEKLRLGWSPE